MRRYSSALDDAPDQQAPDVVVIVETGDEELKRSGRVVDRRRYGFEDLVEEYGEGEILALGLAAAETRARIAVEHRKVELLVAGAEIDEEVVNLVEDFARAGIGAVDLVDHQYRNELGVHRLFEHEASLG